MWDPEEARARFAREIGLTPEQIKIAQDAANATVDGNQRAIQELFETKLNMRGAMQTMDLTNDHFMRAFHSCSKVDDDVTVEGVALGLTMNLVMILRLIQRSPTEILDYCSRAIELSSLFEDALESIGQASPFAAPPGKESPHGSE